MAPADWFRALQTHVDQWQRRTRPAAVVYAVLKKFGDDNLNQSVVGLGWYGFLAVYPALLLLVTILGFIGVASLGSGLVATVHQFPVIGGQFNPQHSSSQLHGSVAGLIIGLVGLAYGAQGVTQSAQAAMAEAWNVPQVHRPGYLPRLARALISLFIIGGSFVANAAVAAYATASSTEIGLRILTLVAMLLFNWLAFAASFRSLTPRSIGGRAFLPGAAFGAFGFTALITVGSGLVEHQLRHSSSTYGQFGAVIGLVGFLLLLAKISLYGAELNVVLARRLWPRGLDGANPTEADHRVLTDLTQQTQRRDDQVIDVGFGGRGDTDPAGAGA